MNNILADTAEFLGYKPKGYGFVKQTKNNKHWVTFFDPGCCQFYCYENDNPELDYVYTSGILENVTHGEFIVLACAFLRSHK